MKEDLLGFLTCSLSSADSHLITVGPLETLRNIPQSSDMVHFTESLSLEGRAPWNGTTLARKCYFLQCSIHPRKVSPGSILPRIIQTNMLAFTNFEGSPETEMLNLFAAEKTYTLTALSGLPFLPEGFS